MKSPILYSLYVTFIKEKKKSLFSKISYTQGNKQVSFIFVKGMNLGWYFWFSKICFTSFSDSAGYDNSDYFYYFADENSNFCHATTFWIK